MARTPRRRFFGEPLAPSQDRTRISAEGVGAPSSEVIEAGQEITADVRDANIEIIKDAERSQILNLSNQVDELKSGIEREALNTKGANALGVDEEAQTRFNEGLEDIQKQAFTTVQKRAMEELKAKGERQISESTERHMLREDEKVKSMEFSAKTKNILESSLLHWDSDERLVENSIDFTNLSLDEAERQGLKGEALDAFMFDRMSTYHSTVFTKKIDQGDRRGAEAYLNFFNEDRGQVNASAVDHMNELLEEADFRGDAQSETDKIMGKKDGTSITSEPLTWAQRFEEARNIKDPEMRDEVTNRLKSRRQLDRSLEEEAKDKIFQGASNSIDANPGAPIRDSISVSDWNRLSSTDKAALKRQHAFSDPKQNMKTDWDAFFGFYGIDPADRANLSEREFRSKYWSRLDEQNRNKIFNQWQKDIKNTRDNKNKSMKGILSAEDHMNNELRELGWVVPGKKTSGDDALRNQRLVSEFDTWLIGFRTQNNGDDPAKEEIEKQVRKLAAQNFRGSGGGKPFSRFSLSREKIRENLNEGKLHVSLSEARGGLTSKQFNTISNLLRSRSVVDPGTEEFRDKVRRIGAAMRAGNDEMAEQILNGRVK